MISVISSVVSDSDSGVVTQTVSLVQLVYVVSFMSGGRVDIGPSAKALGTGPTSVNKTRRTPKRAPTTYFLVICTAFLLSDRCFGDRERAVQTACRWLHQEAIRCKAWIYKTLEVGNGN